LGLSLPPDQFLQQLEYLLHHRWRIGPVRELLEQPEHGVAFAAISFDDALESQLVAAEILDAKKIQATFFAPAGCLGGTLGGKGYWSRWKCMRTEDLQRLHRAGHEIGSHGMFHQGPLHRLPDPEARQELVRSREFFAEKFGEPKPGFSYPFGGFSRSLSRQVKEAGYAYGACSRPGPWRNRRLPYSLPRIEVAGTDSFRRFSDKVRGIGETRRLFRYFFSKILRG